MALFRFRGLPRPYLAPELDDARLGAVCERLEAPAGGLAPMDIGQGLADIRLTLAEQLLDGIVPDWERRTHRCRTLARAIDPGLARRWAERRPDSAELQLLRAWTELETGRREQHVHSPQDTVDACRHAAGLLPDDPAPWTALLGVLRLLRRPAGEVFPVWHEVARRDAWHREACLQMLGYLSPDEGGSSAQEIDFVDAAESAMPPGAPATGLRLHAFTARYRRTLAAGGPNAVLAGHLWHQPPVRACVDRALAEWLRPDALPHATALADLNLLAYALVHAHRPADALRVFRRVGGVVAPWPWELDGDPVRAFTRAREGVLP
ncbi:hypothetical protein [Streptomyces sp. HNM0574]|uniref:hypothetical protein n=1 Tax=Streptomyces sp. HNM0574 TaxID=2714954 RepID=UPI00146B9991|nr:hypothetical protein [Streptomyces sp. HNM0574]NLU68309.1 hypothetical protein [Streptomyces sp. HNM0574]